MNFFEQELQRLVKNCPELKSPVFAGRACFAELGGDVRVKLQFVTLGYADHYEAIKATVLNRTEGEVDATLFRFQDIWASEILPTAISVTKRHFPGMAHMGDLTKLHGGELPPVDIITFGSPC